MALPIPPNTTSTLDPEAPHQITNATPTSNTNNNNNNPSSGPAFTAMQKVKTNLVLRSKWAELNGAMGDLGTYIPIVLALTLSRNLNLGTTLIFTGIYNIVTGAIYGVPMPVQPMKSIAAVALADPTFSVPEIMASGILTGAVLLVLGLTGLMQLAYTLIPISVVRGIQLAQGLSFALTAVKYVRKVQDLPKSKSLENRNWLGFDGLVLAIACVCFIVVVNGAGDKDRSCGGGGDVESERSTSNFDSNASVVVVVGDDSDEGRTSRIGRKVRKIVFSLPSAFIVFVLGVVLAFVRRPQVVHEIKMGPSSIEVVKFTKHVWKDGFVKGTIPQLPLSILNSVIAVCKLTSDLFPGKDFSATSLSVTVGLMNLAGGWFGAMPCCHGAGGLAGQYKFGGRSGGCVAILGAAKLVLGFVLGSSLAHIFNQFPVGILGALLLFAGIELAMASRDMKNKEDSFVMLICTAVSLVGSSAALGFLSGMVVFFILRLRDWTKGKPLSSFCLRGSPQL
ncbi:TATA-binding protein-associated factor mot1 [Stylosanthes scabra]|uniref:TATA-binding protein-associated factor mot1 n=1 Tax=Stylosanthes scabra TaxID=79078 RepID=A0ABU6RP96_9FABA|nr:TATA-binding protein-associated factor mot1 [Stylosanthes scabra]